MPNHIFNEPVDINESVSSCLLKGIPTVHIRTKINNIHFLKMVISVPCKKNSNIANIK